MNKVELKGKLGRCKTGYGPKGGAYAFFSMKADGEKSFIDCKAFDDAAEVLQDIEEGAEISITGSLKPDKQKDKDGTERWRTVVVAASVEAGAPSGEDVAF